MERTAQGDPGRTKRRQLTGALDSAPADFEPAAHPIIARHFFGIEPIRPIDQVAGEVVADFKRQRQIKHVYSLGVRAVGEILFEVAEGEDLDRALDAYERLTPSLLEAVGADRFPPSSIYQVEP